MYKHTRGAGGGRVPKKLPAAGLYWSGTLKAAKSLASHDLLNDEEHSSKVSAPRTVPLNEIVRLNREIAPERPSDVGKVLLRRRTKTSGSPKVSERPIATEVATKRTLYVGNLPRSVTGHDLLQIFSEAGNVLSSQVIIDRVSKRSRGFGFVEMVTDNAAEEAITRLNGRNLKGRVMLVKRAQPRQGRYGSDHKPGRPLQGVHRPNEATTAAKNPRVVSRSEIGAPNRVEQHAAPAQKDAHRRSKASWKPARRRKGKNVPEWKDTFRWQSGV